jgi:hypothetical protein
MSVTNFQGNDVFTTYQAFLSSLPELAQNFLSLFALVLLVSIYAVFIWKFYRFVATKNILKLNLSKYNREEHPKIAKLIAAGFYFLEYIIILPFLIFFWFTVFTLFLIFLTEDLELSNLLLISATIIAAIRMTAYYEGDLAKDLAKLLPFTLLGLSITKQGFFNIERILGNFEDLPLFFDQILIYLSFIIILEIILRFFEFISSIFKEDSPPKIEEKL